MRLIDADALIKERNMSISTITNKDNLVVIPNNPSDAYQIGYAIGYQDGKCDAASPWHRVEEPPKEYGNYLAVVNGEVMEVTYSDMSVSYGWTWSTCDAEGFVWIRSESVTHWMPLPEPPKEEEHGN